MSTALADLKSRLGQIEDLKAAANVLSWDQETYMPPGGAEARAYQLSTLQTLAHEKFVADKTGELLNHAEEEVNGADPLSTDASLVRVTRRDYERDRKLPASLVSEISKTVSEAKEAWKKARAADDFDIFAPLLRRIVELNVEKAEAIGYEDEPYDALLDEYEPGMRTATVVDTFRDLRDDLVPIVDAIASSEQVDNAVLHGTYPIKQQKSFGQSVIRDLGYDFDRGREDVSAHPFTTSFSIGDVRLTTRYDESFFPAAFFSTLHEAGHGLYEQGIDPSLDRTPLADGTSLGMHESQSRLYENLVGRSRTFWSHYFDDLQNAFPEAVGDTDLDTFYRAINRVEPSLIRVESDEVTYNLHIMLRFELERGLIDGRIDVDDLPDLWREKMNDYLGVVPETDADGVLQDVHWSLGAIGYFPTYALGNLMSVQLMNTIREELSDVDGDLANGRFGPLLDWLRENVHEHGRKLTAPQLLERVTGEGLSADPWIEYVRSKFGDLYDLD
ncbi:carboxypeptidase [Longibacter salinarum]|uniref:Metal-dependent carboxypeptidase n=1 Tax=Longibacter salinarum TaxID=1850348 RepID=A0A2A8CXX3_9BACT|nr:carboxypeptidase M32 [Longibacter salinarum]PEN13545.1 carboxypeptidase [Longibacter salinarum]